MVSPCSLQFVLHMLFSLHSLKLLLTGGLHTDQLEEAELTLDAVLALGVGCGHAGCSEQLIHLFQGAALGLRDHENDVHDADDGDTAEEDERAVGGLFDEWGCSCSDREVVQLEKD